MQQKLFLLLIGSKCPFVLSYRQIMLSQILTSAAAYHITTISPPIAAKPQTVAADVFIKKQQKLFSLMVCSSWYPIVLQYRQMMLSLIRKWAPAYDTTISFYQTASAEAILTTNSSNWVSAVAAVGLNICIYHLLVDCLLLKIGSESVSCCCCWIEYLYQQAACGLPAVEDRWWLTAVAAAALNICICHLFVDCLLLKIG